MEQMVDMIAQGFHRDGEHDLQDLSLAVAG